MLIGGLIVVMIMVIFLIKKLSHFIEYRYMNFQAKKPSLLKEFIKAKKAGICPRLLWKEDKIKI